MNEKWKSPGDERHESEDLEKEQQKLAALEKQMPILARQKERRDQADKKGPNILGIILVMAAVWGLYGLQLYYRHHNNHLFLVILSAVLAVSGSGYLVYCLNSKRTYTVNYWSSTRGIWSRLRSRGEWTYRDEDPFTYWLYMAFVLFFAGIMIYEFFDLLIKGAV